MATRDDDEAIAAGLLDHGNSHARTHAEHFFGLLPRPDPPVESSEQHRDRHARSCADQEPQQRSRRP